MFYYSPSHNFQKKNQTKTKFLISETSSSFSFFYSLPFAKSIYANKTPVLLVLSLNFFSLKNSSVFLKWISLETKHVFVFFFLTSFSSVLFSSLLVFVHHVSHSPPFSFPFRLTFYFLDLLLLELSFFEQFPFCIKKTYQFIVFYTHALPLYVLLLMDLFICCLFLFVFSIF